jgi:hypothetical protein
MAARPPSSLRLLEDLLLALQQVLELVLLCGRLSLLVAPRVHVGLELLPRRAAEGATARCIRRHGY